MATRHEQNVERLLRQILDQLVHLNTGLGTVQKTVDEIEEDVDLVTEQMAVSATLAITSNP
jgi:hypothetical protein